MSWDAEPYACAACKGTAAITQDGEVVPCEPCDGVGVTAVDCAGCGRKAVPIHETVFVAAIPRTYCEPCGDRELEKLALRRGREKW